MRALGKLREPPGTCVRRQRQKQTLHVDRFTAEAQAFPVPPASQRLRRAADRLRGAGLMAAELLPASTITAVSRLRSP